MINTSLLVFIILYFLYAFYDQFLMEKRFGETILKVRLRRKSKIEGIIMLALVGVAIYQALPQGIEPYTMFLLVMFGILMIYHFFIRYPVFILKKDGFFLNNLYLQYAYINTINIGENGFLQLVLKNSKAVPLVAENPKDVEKILQYLTDSGRISQDQNALEEAKQQTKQKSTANKNEKNNKKGK
ncbi:YobD family protein [Avibacterium avium]|uniref:YobD family protein n=1 Tax=Avibacterium avium TaxID=751 RepID=UPI003BF79729